MSDKAATLKTLDDEYRNLHKTFAGLDDDQLERVWFGDWSVRDIVAHVTGWEREMTAALQRMARGERPTPEGTDYSDSDGWNARFAATARSIATRTVVAIWEQTHATYVGAANALPDDRFGESDGKPKTANRLLETSGFGHYREHAAQIREWRQREGL